VIHKDNGSDYGVTVPDLPGCFSAGATLDEALAMAREAIELHVEGLIAEGLPVPEPTSIEERRNKSDHAGGTWAVVAINPATLRAHSKRINITMPERILDAVDRYADRRGETRSGLLARAAMEYIGRQSDAALASASRRQLKARRSQRRA
jgi:predicted RNase H-like HicB family nuclease